MNQRNPGKRHFTATKIILEWKTKGQVSTCIKNSDCDEFVDVAFEDKKKLLWFYLNLY